MTDTNKNIKEMQIFMIEHGKLVKHTFSDAVEDGDYIHFGKHEILDSYKHLWEKEKLGIAIDEIFTIDARVAFFEDKDMTDEAAKLLAEHLEKRKALEEEGYQATMRNIERLKNELSSKSFKDSKK